MNRWRILLVTCLAIFAWSPTLCAQTNADRERLAVELLAAVKDQNRATILELLDQGADPNLAWMKTRRIRESALHLAVDSGDIESTRMLLEAGADPWAETDRNFPASFLANTLDDREMLNFLLKQGIDINRPNSRGETLLYWAVLWDPVDQLRFLLENGADPEIASKEGKTPLMNVRTGEKVPVNQFNQQVDLLVQYGADLNRQDKEGKTFLMQVIRSYDGTAFAKALIAKGADTATRDSYGSDALMLNLMYRDFPEVTSLLLENYRNINAVNHWGDSAFLLAVKAGEKDATEKLLELGADPNLTNKDGETALHLAMRTTVISTIKRLLASGLDPRAKTKDGDEPIHFLAFRRPRSLSLENVAEMLQILLKSGASIDALGEAGNTALHYAASHSPEVVALLVSSDASIDVLNDERESPVSVAVANGNIEVVKLLLEAGAEPTGLHAAAAAANLDMIERLLEAGADPEHRDKSGRLALHRGAAAFHHHFLPEKNTYSELMLRLLKVTGSNDATDSEGVTPLMWVAASNNSEVLDALLEKGANPDRQSNDGRTAAMWAAASGSRETLGLLKAKGADFSLRDADGQTVADWLEFSESNDTDRSTADAPEAGNDRKPQPMDIADAVVLGNLEYVENWLSNNPDRIDESFGGLSLLHLAAISGRNRISGELLRAGANPAAKSTDDSQALHWAIYRGDLEIVKQLLEKDAPTDTEIFSVNELLGTPLMLAIQNGHEDVFRELLANGADPKPNSADLMAWAVAENQIEALAALLDLGLDPLSTEQESKPGEPDPSPSPFVVAGRIGSIETLELLMAKIDDSREDDLRAALEDAYREACEMGKGEMVRYFVEVHGFDVNHPFPLPTWKKVDTDAVDGQPILHAQTPLSLLIEGGHLATIRYLLEHGARIEGHTNNEESPFLDVLRYRRADLIELFYSHDPPINFVNSKGVTPLMITALEGTFHDLKRLVDAGADLTPKSNLIEYENQWGPKFQLRDGVTAFHISCYRGDERMANYLMQHGANTEEVDGLGRSALHQAVIGDNEAMCLWLLERGFSSRNLESDKGESPIETAIRTASIPVIELLLGNDVEKIPELLELAKQANREQRVLDFFRSAR